MIEFWHRVQTWDWFWVWFPCLAILVVVVLQVHALWAWDKRHPDLRL